METLIQSTRVAGGEHLWPPQTPRDRVAYGVIIGAGVICFALLAWVHLGLGALLFPPAATARQQVVRAGDYRVTLQLGSGQLTAGGPNTVELMVRDAAGHIASVAQVRVQPVMTTMAMEASAVTALSDGAGAYAAHPKFGMAGTWRLEVTVTPTVGSPWTASFEVTVHWN